MGSTQNDVKDEQGVVLWEHDNITDRRKGYYGKLLNEENPMTVFGNQDSQTKV